MDELPSRILSDVYNFFVFNEADLQAVVYHWTTTWMERNYPSDAARPRFLLNQPALRVSGQLVRPDLVMFHGHQPIVAIELKCELNRPSHAGSEKDIEKLRVCKTAYPTLKNAYFLYLYDSDSDLDVDVEDWMKRYFFTIPVNVRRHPTRRLRNRYVHWRRKWKRLYKHFQE